MPGRQVLAAPQARQRAGLNVLVTPGIRPYALCQKFDSTWRDTLSVLVARGRAQVGVHSARTDWSRRILEFQRMGYDDQVAHHA